MIEIVIEAILYGVLLLSATVILPAAVTLLSAWAIDKIKSSKQIHNSHLEKLLKVLREKD